MQTGACKVRGATCTWPSKFSRKPARQVVAISQTTEFACSKFSTCDLPICLTLPPSSMCLSLSVWVRMCSLYTYMRMQSIHMHATLLSFVKHCSDMLCRCLTSFSDVHLSLVPCTHWIQWPVFGRAVLPYKVGPSFVAAGFARLLAAALCCSGPAGRSRRH